MPGPTFAGWKRGPEPVPAAARETPEMVPYTEGRGNSELLEMFGFSRPEKRDGWGFDWTYGEEERPGFQRDPMVEFGLGHLDDGRTGVRAKAGVTERHQVGGPLWFEAGSAGCGVESTDGPDGTTIGAGCQAGAAAAIIDESHPSKSHDSYRRGGVSEGPSLGFRLHSSDRDGDGEVEHGYGFDVGPFSYDHASEDWWRLATDHNPASWWVGPLVNELF